MSGNDSLSLSLPLPTPEQRQTMADEFQSFADRIRNGEITVRSMVQSGRKVEIVFDQKVVDQAA